MSLRPTGIDSPLHEYRQIFPRSLDLRGEMTPRRVDGSVCTRFHQWAVPNERPRTRVFELVPG
jgi:hypothetical protein